ncbi:MAG: hypothetical protein DRJ37_00025 [Thermoprotei archaeon]|nr:MAG: hypothetical protein DRJ37_00025 [Thermoprotei archaeon]RLG85887.1 MAG: hypothetical protein DRO15_06905 [Thermoprotei archaeon]
MWLHYLFSILTIIFALVAVEVKDLFKSILAFTIMNVFLSVIYYLIGAPYVAVFQLSVYAGGVTVLLLAFMHVRGGEEGEG